MSNKKFSADPNSVKNSTVPNDTNTEFINAVDFLPKYHQTATNKKLFNVTLDPLISKGTAEDISAYVGRKSGTVYRPARDPYLTEVRKSREDSQLDIGVVSKDSSGNVTGMIAYGDLLDKFKAQYSNFTADDLDVDYFTWAPPIDADKFVNFSHYYWLPYGMPAIEVSGDIDIDADIVSKAVYVTPTQPNGKRLNFHNGAKVFFTNNNIADKKYVTLPDASRKFAYSTGAEYSVADLISANYILRVSLTYSTVENFYGEHTVSRTVMLPEYSKVNGEVVGVNWKQTSDGVLTISDSVILAEAISGSIEVEVQVINRPVIFTVDGISRRITLLPQQATDPRTSYVLYLPEGWDTQNWDITAWDATTPGHLLPEYIVMARGSNNWNAWSRINQWVHIESIQETFEFIGKDYSYLTTPEFRGKRPIIEFYTNIALVNHGDWATGQVDAVLDGKQDVLSSVLGQVAAKVDGVNIYNKNRILVLNTGSNFDNKIVTVTGVGESIEFAFPADADPTTERTVFVRSGKKYQFNELWYDTYLDTPVWKLAQQKTKRNQFPQFELYDANGIKLSDTSVYKNSNFTGSTLFQYKAGSFVDPVLGFGVEYEDNSYDIVSASSPYSKTFANLKFLFTQNASDLYYEVDGKRTAIPGYYYHKVYRESESDYSLSNGWVRNSQEPITFQRISKVAASSTESVVVPADIFASYDYQLFLNAGTPFFNIITKENKLSLLDPLEKHLIFPIGRTATIFNYTGIPLTLLDKYNNPLSNVTNNGADYGLITVDLDSTNVDAGESGCHYAYYTINGYTNAIEMIDPKQDPRFLQVRVNGRKLSSSQYILTQNIDSTYTVQVDNLSKNDVVEVMFVSEEHYGVYATHSTLEANANNATVYETSYSKVFEHFTSVISSQLGFKGSAYGSNTYHESARNIGLGYVIQQQQNSLLPIAALANAGADVLTVLEASGTRYANFRAKFITRLQNINNVLDVNAMMPADLVDTVLKAMNVGKDASFVDAFSNVAYYSEYLEFNYTGDGVTKSFAHNKSELFNGNKYNHVYFYVNGLSMPVGTATIGTTTVDFAVAPALGEAIKVRVYSANSYSFIPHSLATLGINKMHNPAVYTDTTKGSRRYIRCHDGSEVTMYDGVYQYVNNAILELERRIYLNSNRAQLSFTEFSTTNIPGYYRVTSESLQDLNRYLEQHYLVWASNNNILTMENTGYDETNPFTWNYSSPENAHLGGGSYKAIYQYLFDTSTPHLTPWEMLGFNSSPQWWGEHYSWTNATKRAALENALRKGITSDPSQPVSIEPRLARVGAVFPVDAAGNLLDPIAAGIANNPGADIAASDWKFGDIGQQEYAWRTSPHFQWALAAWEYVEWPSKFVGANFDPVNLVRVANKTQIVNVDTQVRNSLASTVLHRQTGEYKYGLNYLCTEYVVSQNKDLTAYFDSVHNSTVQLIHRIGGFADKRTLKYKADTLKSSASGSFVPEENFSLHLYESAPIATVFYSGVKVTWTGTAYKVTGYDKINHNFVAYMPKQGGRSRAVTFNGITMLDVLDYSETPSVIPYGTEFTSRQDVYNFFVGLHKYMTEIGFVFDQFDTEQDGFLDFKLAGKQFMFWSDSKWEAGNFIALSPLSNVIKFNYNYGWVQDYNKITQFDPVVDIEGKRVLINDIDVDRVEQGIVTISAKSTPIYGIAIRIVELEHAAIFDNLTIFGDTIYNPLYRLKQYRLKYIGQRTRDWDGSPRTPGFVINGDKILGNFDRIIADISDKYYSVEGSTQNTRLQATARHSVGMDGASALSRIIDNPATQFEFQRPAVRQKGTPAAYSKLLRTSLVDEYSSDSILADEEWMFKLGDFGNIESINSWEFKLAQQEIKDAVQLLEFDDSYKFNQVDRSYAKIYDKATDTVITMPADDVRWIYKPYGSERLRFPTRKHSDAGLEILYPSDNVTAGYAVVADADFTCNNLDDVAVLFSSLTELTSIPQWTSIGNYKPGDLVRHKGQLYKKKPTIIANSTEFDATQWDAVTEKSYKLWISDYISNQDGLNAVRSTNQSVPLGWNMLVLQDTKLAAKSIISSNYDLPTAPAIVEFEVAHGYAVGDFVIIINSGTADGIYPVQQADEFTITVDALVPADILGKGKVMGLQPTRFDSLAQLTATLTSAKYNWQERQHGYVDNVAGSYTIYEVDANGQLVVDTMDAEPEQDLVDTRLVNSVKVYDKVSNRLLVDLDIYDPYKGFIPRAAQNNIDIRSNYDPAVYDFTSTTDDDTSATSSWGLDQVGTVWWDISTAKFLNYETMTTAYRRANWGKLFPGASIDVYQWIESPVDPIAYNNASQSGTPIGDYVPVGFAKVQHLDQTDIYSYSTRDIINADGTTTTKYYFWVKGLDTIAQNRTDKTLSVAAIAAIIKNPSEAGIAWAAPISDSAMLISGVTGFLNNDSTSVQLQLVDVKEDNLDINPTVHSQWMLLRENDSVNRVPEWLHNRLRDSLAGFDRNIEVAFYADYSNTKKYTAGSVFYRPTDGNYYRVFRNMSSADLAVTFDKRPFYKLYDYTLLPADFQKRKRIAIQARRDVPNFRTSEFDRFGNRIRPAQQTWIKNRDEARRTFIASANKLLATMDLFDTVPNWDKHLVEITSGTLSYDITKFYTVVDFVAADYSPTKTIVKEYATELDINVSELSSGDYVLVQNATRYAVYQISGSERILKFKSNATIQFTEDLFNSLKQQYSWDLAPWDFTKWDNEPGVEFGEIVTALREDIFIDNYAVNYNRLFFDMVRYIFSENNNVDWIAKSSYIYIDNLDVDSLKQQPYLDLDKVQQYIDYINEVKPYRTKIRQVIDTRSVTDTASVTIEDSNSLEIEVKFDRTDVRPVERNYISGGRFGVENVDNISGGVFGVINDDVISGGTFGASELVGDQEIALLTVSDSLQLEVVTKYDTATYSYAAYITDSFAKYYALHNSLTTTLVSAITSDTTEIKVTDGSVLPAPDQFTNTPGVILVNGEYIAYFEKQGNILRQLVRTYGTIGLNSHAAGSIVCSVQESNKLLSPLSGHIGYNAPGFTLLETTSGDATRIVEEQGF